MESESKKKLRSPFKFTLTTSALTPKKGGNSEVKVQGPQLLQPKSSLDYSDKPGNARVARTESENKPRFSMLSSLRNNTLGAHTKSESKLSNLDHTNHIEVKENGRDALNAEVKWRERGIDVGDQASPVYDRPRSQIYTSTPLSSVVTDDVEYDTPRSRSFVSDGELNTKNGNEQMSAVVSQLETPPQSPKEKRKGMVMMVSKSLFHSYNSNEKDDIISSNCDTRDRYNMNTTDAGNSMHQKSDQHSDAILQKKQSLRLDTGTSGTAAIVPTECNLSAQPVAPPRKHSNARTPTRTMSSPLSSPSNHDADVTTSPRVPSRRRRLTRKISLGAKKLDDDEFIGFASLPEQVHRKAVKRGFEFSLMVVGETGLGKSTLINSLFLTDLYKDRELPSAEESVERTVEIEKKQLEIEERGVKVRLSVVDTPGFNDAVNGDEHWQSITDYVDRQFDQYYQAESGVNRKNIQDTRVHCCLYFISPYGHGLKPLDVFIMKKLHNKVNIVPLIAKSDILTPKEVKQLKTTVLEEIQKHSINIYQFPECDSDEDEEFKQQDKALKSAIPFAVVGSNTVVEVAGKKIRGRMYPWGIVEVDNPKHCDFGKLRQMLISTHMQDLKDITSDVHYENYRAEHIAQEKNKSQRARTKLKRDSIANLEDVNTTETLLAQKEAEIERMQAMLTKMQAQLQNSPRSPMNGN